jgi:hypothetical protein
MKNLPKEVEEVLRGTFSLIGESLIDGQIENEDEFKTQQERIGQVLLEYAGTQRAWFVLDQTDILYEGYYTGVKFSYGPVPFFTRDVLVALTRLTGATRYEVSEGSIFTVYWGESIAELTPVYNEQVGLHLYDSTELGWVWHMYSSLREAMKDANNFIEEATAFIYSLPKKIATVDDAKEFLRLLHYTGRSYHPEDNPFDIVGGVFNQHEAMAVKVLMAEVYNLPGNKGKYPDLEFDPCGYLLELEGHVMEEDEE